MNVNQWFEIHAKKPIRYILVLFVLLNVAFLTYTFIQGSKNQHEIFENNTVSPLIISLQNSDRVLMEHILKYSVENLGAKEIYLCQNNIVISSPSSEIDKCSDIKFSSWHERVTTFKLSAFEGYKVHIVASIWPFTDKDLWFIPLSVVILFLVNWFVNRLQKRIAVDIVGSVGKIFEGSEKIDIEEFEIFREKFLALKKKNEKERQVNKESESTRSLFHNLNNQVGILEGLKEKVSMTDRQKRLFSNAIFQIRKMSDRSKAEIKSQSNGDMSIADILPMLSNLVQNKELVAVNSGKSISISLENSSCLDRIFCKINTTEFRSVIGNLINNSLEASATRINLNIEPSTEGHFKVKISDDGSGIPTVVRHKLFEKNFTYGKENGSGIGLYHAKKSLESWGGKIDFEPNEEGRGSVFVLTVKEFEVPEISICNSTKILVLDDDAHDRVRLLEKLSSSLPGTVSDNILDFNNYDDAAVYLNQHKDEKNILFSDYDLGTENKTGLDLIKSFSLEHLSCLVTNSYDSEGLVQECMDANISIVPKPQLSNLKINLVS